LGEAARQMHRWQTELADDINDVTLSVNFSRKQFYQPDLIAHIDRIIAEGNASPGRIKIEVGEQVIMQNAESSIKILGQLRQRGIGLSIDDFGTGYSSLSYLQQFPIATLKIDRVFVTALSETGKAGLINSILALARSLNVDALAEGVETAEQVERLRDLGIRYAQGYFFSAPVPAEEAAHFITAGSLT
jgi:EAL domain-containing protein (putative c-di-GMP-specific phosphodiesterase class I)